MNWGLVAAAIIGALVLQRFAPRVLSRGTLYVRVHANRIHARNVGNGQEADLTSPEGFSHPRTVLGNFTHAEALMKQCLKKFKGTFYPRVVVHPVGETLGGLTQIEERAFLELACGAGARPDKIVIWTGADLTDAQVLEKVKN